MVVMILGGLIIRSSKISDTTNTVFTEVFSLFGGVCSVGGLYMTLRDVNNFADYCGENKGGNRSIKYDVSADNLISDE